jgi:hypothetical protein
MRRPIHCPAILWTALALTTMTGIGEIAAEEPANAASRGDLSRVQLVLVLDPAMPMGEGHQWMERLSRAGIERVRIRSFREGDRVAVETLGSESAPRYRVTGFLRGSGIRLPEAFFRPSQMESLKDWLEKQTAGNTPEGEPDNPAAKGIDPEIFKLVFEDLSKPVDFQTRGLPKGYVLTKIVATVDFPIHIDADLKEALHAIPTQQEYRGLSFGTTLASMLRPLGLILIIKRESNRGVGRILPEAEEKDDWPVGWERQKSKKELIPELYSQLRTQLDAVPLNQMLQAVSKRLEVPHLLDRKALQALEIDPKTKEITLSTRRVTYDQLLGQALYRCKLKHEVRQDDAGHPFLWITSLRPLKAENESK